MSTAQRELTFLLAAPERRLLIWMAARLPRPVTSDHLTVLGALAAASAGAAYALTSLGRGWLWLASAALALNWLGDSLDGTLARVRRAERPRYGYYVDHLVDAFSTAAVGIGIGLSPYVELEVALVLVVGYLALSINLYLESAVFGVFRLGYGRIGPTEARIMLVLANTLLALWPAPHGSVPWAIAAAANGALATLAALMSMALAVRFVRNLRRLAKEEAPA